MSVYFGGILGKCSRINFKLVTNSQQPTPRSRDCKGIRGAAMKSPHDQRGDEGRHISQFRTWASQMGIRLAITWSKAIARLGPNSKSREVPELRFQPSPNPRDGAGLSKSAGPSGRDGPNPNDPRPFRRSCLPTSHCEQPFVLQLTPATGVNCFEHHSGFWSPVSRERRGR